MTDCKTIDLHPHTTLRVGGWLPHHPGAMRSYVAELIEDVEANPTALLPPVQALADLIDNDPGIGSLARQMIRQVPAKYKTNPAHAAQIQSVEQMLALINAAIAQPPPFNDSELVGFPINAILDWSMGTLAGSTFFLLEPVNEAMKAILQYWCDYLWSAESLVAFHADSWGSPDAQKKIDISRYAHTGSVPPWGFTSWNNFFTRTLAKYNVDDPKNDSIIVSACESTPFAIQNGVKKEDTFWIKEQPYSLDQMLAGESVDEFVGGTVYQAFLSAFNYHRWHTPVSGTVVSAHVEDGTYYAESLSEGFDPGGPNLSQGYIAHLAARAIILIEADNKAIGLVAVIPIGMSEVSSNVLRLKNGDPLTKGVHVDKGDQLGYFQFGGSTHCLIFQPGVIESFDVNAIPGPGAMAVEVGSKIATARI